LHNASFESGLTPWKAWKLRFAKNPTDGSVKISQVTSGTAPPSGGKHAARVTLVSGKCNEGSWACGMGIEQLGLAKPNDYTCYVASAYVRAANAATVGKSVQVTAPEYSGKSEYTDFYGSSVRLTTAWQRVTLDPVAIEQQGDTLAVKVEMDGARAGNAFDTDLVWLRNVGNNC
jgi:hypothetical protein